MRSTVGNEGISIVIPAGDLSEIACVAARVEAFCADRKISRCLAGKFNLALDEVLTNIMTHACSGGRRCEISIRVDYRDGDLAALVCDDGEPFNPLLQSPPDFDAAIEDRPIGGLGIHLLRTLMDSVDYRWTEGHNRLAFRLHVDPADPAP